MCNLKKTISRPIHRTDSQKQDRCAFLQPSHVWRPDDFPPVILMLCPSIVLESVCGVENSEAVNEQNEWKIQPSNNVFKQC